MKTGQKVFAVTKSFEILEVAAHDTPVNIIAGGIKTRKFAEEILNNLINQEIIACENKIHELINKQQQLNINKI